MPENDSRHPLRRFHQEMPGRVLTLKGFSISRAARRCQAASLLGAELAAALTQQRHLVLDAISDCPGL